MTVARAAYTDLFLAFTPGASTQPTATAVGNLITNLYRDAYRFFGETYAAYNAAAEHAILDTENCKGIIITAASRITSHMQERLSPPPESQRGSLELSFNTDERNQLAELRPCVIWYPTYTTDAPATDGYNTRS
jgi:hypothetical protein